CAYPVRVEACTRKGRIRRGWDRVALEKGLGIGLRSLEPRGCGDRTEAPQPCAREGIDDSRDKWAFGPDDREIDPLLARETKQTRQIVGRNCDVTHARLEGGAGITGRDVHLRDPRGLRHLPGERVLASAAADDEDAHAQCRKWRMPVN